MVLVYLKSMLGSATANLHILFYPQKCWSWLPLVRDNLRILIFLIIVYVHTYRKFVSGLFGTERDCFAAAMTFGKNIVLKFVLICEGS